VWNARGLHLWVETAQFAVFYGSPPGGQAAIPTALSMASDETMPGNLLFAAAALVLHQRPACGARGRAGAQASGTDGPIPPSAVHQGITPPVMA